MSDCKDWPIDWPWYKQGCFVSFDQRCDALVGPCSCAASHKENEFELRDGLLYRYGERVVDHNVNYEHGDSRFVRSFSTVIDKNDLEK